MLKGLFRFHRSPSVLHRPDSGLSVVLFDNLAAGVRERLAGLPEQTRIAWKWDLASGFFTGIYFGCTWTFIARVARADLGATGAQMGWIAAAPALGYLFAPVWARQMEGRAKLPFVYWTWLLARGMYLLAPLVHSSAQFVALVCLSTLIFSVSTPAYTAVMKDIYDDRHRGRLMSAVRIVMSVMTLVTALVMGRWLDAGLDWQVGFGLGGLFGACSAWTFSRIPVPPALVGDEPPLSTTAFVRDTVDILRRNPGFRWFSASVFLYGFGNIMCSTLYPIHQVDRFHVTNTEVANLQNLGSVMTILGFFFWGTFLDRRGPLALVLLSVSTVCTMPLFYAFGNHIGWLYVAAAAGGLAMSGIDLGYLNTTLLFAEPGRAAQYQALHSSIFGVRGSIAPHCAIPLMQEIGPQGAFLVGFAVMLLGVGLQLISMRDYRRQVAEARRAAFDAGRAE